MERKQVAASDSGRSAAETAVAMSKVLFEFGQIKRATKMPNGEYESDSHHCFTLALIGYELARAYAPELDAMKVMAYGLVHDLPEVVTGDVHTLLASPEALERKKAKDREALESLRHILAVAPHTLDVLEDFDRCDSEEAKFVYWLDKTMTILTHFFDEGKNLRALGIEDQAAIEQWYDRLLQKLTGRAANPHATASEVLETLYCKMHDELLPTSEGLG